LGAAIEKIAALFLWGAPEASSYCRPRILTHDVIHRRSTARRPFLKEEQDETIYISACVAALVATLLSIAASRRQGAGILPRPRPWAASSSNSPLPIAEEGAVVLYFYPAAFTPGCTIEAHNFADAMDDFQKLGAT